METLGALSFFVPFGSSEGEMSSAKTSVYGIVGSPVTHSWSPVLHTAGYQHLGLDAVYVPFPVNEAALSVAMKGLPALGVKGINVTVPYKMAVLPFVTELTPQARDMGAVNTIRFLSDGHAIGTNTDGDGFWHDVAERGLGLPSRLGILGSGGAARAVALGFAQRGGQHLVVLNRTLANAQRLCTEIQAGYSLSCEMGDGSDGVPFSRCDMVVNTTSATLADGTTPPMPMSWVSPGQVVADLMYGRPSPWLDAAKSKGATTFDGWGMLIHQGVLAFAFMTGHPVPVSVFRAAVSHVEGLSF